MFAAVWQKRLTDESVETNQAYQKAVVHAQTGFQTFFNIVVYNLTTVQSIAGSATGFEVLGQSSDMLRIRLLPNSKTWKTFKLVRSKTVCAVRWPYLCSG